MKSLKNAAENKVEGIGKSLPTFKVNPRLLTFEPGFNARPIDQDQVNGFKSSYKSGAHVPHIVVRPGSAEDEIIVVDGHHRTAALWQLLDEGEEIVSVEVVEFRGNDADRVAFMIGSSQGKPLTPLQAAVQYRKLIGYGWSEQLIASKTGKSLNHIQQMLTLVSANSDVIKMVENGEVAANVAVKMQRKFGDKAGEVLGEALDRANASGKKKVTEKAIKKIDESKVRAFVQGYVGRTIVLDWNDDNVLVSFLMVALEENFK